MHEDNIALPEQRLRYAVYSVRNALQDGLIYSRAFIVVKNGYNVITRFTRLQEYAGIYVHGTYKPITSTPETKLHFICHFLNYALVEHGSELGLRHVFGITKPVLEQFFSHYALEKQPDGSYRSQESVERCISTVTDFMSRLCSRFNGYARIVQLRKERLKPV